jgi:hypothetical protein
MVPSGKRNRPTPAAISPPASSGMPHPVIKADMTAQRAKLRLVIKTSPCHRFGNMLLSSKNKRAAKAKSHRSNRRAKLCFEQRGALLH